MKVVWVKIANEMGIPSAKVERTVWNLGKDDIAKRARACKRQDDIAQRARACKRVNSKRTKASASSSS